MRKTKEIILQENGEKLIFINEKSHRRGGIVRGY